MSASPVVRVLPSVREVTREAWDALLGDDGSPFLEWDWLATLEEAGCLDHRSGWLPQYATLWQGDRLLAACPLFVKGNSQGEFVFDHGWADAAYRAGIAYYPKLLVAAPFTPATGARFLAAPAHRDAAIVALGGVLEQLCDSRQFSSAHVNFCLGDEAEALASRGWLRRTGVQFQWRNAGYATMDDWLGALRHKRRNQTRREMRELAEQGVGIETLAGNDIPESLVPIMFRLYRGHVRKFGPWGHQYLNRRFFELLWARWRRRLCWIVARQHGEVIAGTFNVQKAGVFYGRYWGVERELRHLHFNVCYYAAIGHCIAQGLSRFEPGAGGDFKHLRGFDAAETLSMHYIADARLRAAVGRHLVRERDEVARGVAWFDDRTAHRRDDGGDGDAGE